MPSSSAWQIRFCPSRAVGRLRSAGRNQAARRDSLDGHCSRRPYRSRGVRRGGSGCKLRGEIAMKHGWTDVIEAALEISPDFAADIGPAFAERKILAEIGPGARIDHALEQREAVGASGERIGGMFAEKLQ